MIAPDSSVLIAALDVDHEFHVRSRSALAGHSPRLLAHVAFVAGLRGGALYEALIAATAVRHGATLISADRRAHAA